MELYLILLGLLFLLVLCFFVARKLLKFVLILLFIIFLSGGVLGYMAYQEGKELATHFQTGDIMILLTNHDTALLGFGGKMSHLNGTFDKESFTNLTILSSSTLNSYSLLVARGDYPSLLNSYELLISMDLDTYRLLLDEELIIEGGASLKREELLTLLTSNNPLNSYIYSLNPIFNESESVFIQTLLLSYSIDTSEEFKTYLFLISLGDAYSDPSFLTKLFNLYKEDKLILYPDGFAFPLIIDFLPSTFLSSV